MGESNPLNLGRRERQIVEILYQKGEASVSEVLEAMPDPPSYSAVRAMLRWLEDKGQVRHKQIGKKYVFSPKTPRRKASRSALRNLLTTFFDGSIEEAVASLLDLNQDELTEEELDRLAQLIEEARGEAE